MSKDSKAYAKQLNILKRKCFKDEELDKRDIAFLRMYILNQITTEQFYGAKPLNGNLFETWNIKLYHNLIKLQTILDKPIYGDNRLDENKVFVSSESKYKAVFKQLLIIEKLAKIDYSTIAEEVINVYRDFYLRKYDNDKVILFESNNRKLEVDCNSDTIRLIEFVKDGSDMEYIKPIDVDKLSIFPNSILAKQFLK